MNPSVKRILIVEDNDKNLKLFNLLIKSMGYDCFAANDGATGVKLAIEKLPELILMDIQMPSLDGISALELLKADNKTRMIPVIAVTSYAMERDREKLLKAGFTEYLAKPIDIDLFKETVQRVLGD